MVDFEDTESRLAPGNTLEWTSNPLQSHKDRETLSDQAEAVVVENQMERQFVGDWLQEPEAPALLESEARGTSTS